MLKYHPVHPAVSHSYSASFIKTVMWPQKEVPWTDPLNLSLQLQYLSSATLRIFPSKKSSSLPFHTILYFGCDKGW